MRMLLLALICTLSCNALMAQATPDTSQIIVPGRSNGPDQRSKPYLIMISADGFRWDLADKFHAEHLLALRAGGVAAEKMIPSYPSVTFPNHYSLATGLFPSHHGIVNNTFFDPGKGKGYRISDRTAVRDSSWYGGTPIWVLAEQQQMVSASLFWVGSEAAVAGVRPSYFFYFNDKLPIDTRLLTVKNWLSLPEDRRPHLILFYLSQVDHAEHTYGPASKEAEAAVHQVDNIVWRMTMMVDSLHLPVNYVFVSDHGMAAIDTLQGGLSLPSSIDTSKFTISGSETLQHLFAHDKKDIPAQYAALKKEHAPGWNIYLPDETPAYWHYTSKDDRYGRMGDILLAAQYPHMLYLKDHRLIPGEHGFDNHISDMGATFYAWGPAFKKGWKMPPFENVNVYPLMAHILGLHVPADIDGRFDVLKGGLR